MEQRQLTSKTGVHLMHGTNTSHNTNVVVDIDGTLITNSYITFHLILVGEPIEDNIDWCKSYMNKVKIKIILTTSRPERLRQLTIQNYKQREYLLMNWLWDYHTVKKFYQ